jgi:hypothetical protein
LYQLVDVFMSNWNFKLFWQILYCYVCMSDSPNDPSDVSLYRITIKSVLQLLEELGIET